MNTKKVRYYYWIIREFTKKNARLIFISFLISIISIVATISVSPYLVNLASSKTEIIGLVGPYSPNTLPYEVVSKISNGLVFVNEKGETQPVLANSWEVLESGKLYRFHLKKNLLWNDGKPFTAKDITYSFRDVQTITTDENTISFQLKKPLAIFPTYLAQPILKYPLIGVAGLYKVSRTKVQYGTIKELYLTPNKPNLPILVYKIYDNESKLIDAYKLGEINEMTITKKSLADDFANWKNTDVSKAVDYTNVMTLFFNMNNPRLKDSRELRQAIAMAINKEPLLKQGEDAFSPIPPTSWAHNPDVKKTLYNPDLAGRIIHKEVTSSSSATMTLATYFDYSDMADEMKQNLVDAGLPTEVNIIPFGKPDTFDLFLAVWRVPVDPDQYYFWHSTQQQSNVTGYKNPKIDKLLEDGRDTLKVSERKKIYENFQRSLVDDFPATFLYYPNTYIIKRK